MEEGDNVTLLYACDNWHMHDSMFFMGAFACRHTALQALEDHLRECKLPGLDDDDRRLFEITGQTQGYDGDGEFYSNDVVIGELEGVLA